MPNNRNPHDGNATTRREFLQALATATSGAVFAGTSTAAAPSPEPPAALIDVNVSLSRWPARRSPLDELAPLVEKLRTHGVSQAWAGSFEGLIHRDLAAVNARLAADCDRFGRGLLIPFGSVDPTLPDWEEELRRCVEVHRMPGIRLHPSYHGYNLADPRFIRLLKAAAERRLIVQLAVVMEDERMMHPLLRVSPVDTAPLAQAVRLVPGLRLVLLNALRTLRGAALQKLIDSGDVYVEISMLEGVGGLESLLEQTSVGRVLFGSHAPLFYFESAELKLKESVLRPEHLRAIQFQTANRLRA